jgi:hypothetical protein
MSAPRLFRPLLRVVLTLLLLAGIAAPLSALAAVVSFSQAGLPATPILQDGQAGSADIPGITLQVMNVASDSGGAIGTLALHDDATFFGSNDPSLKAVTHEDGNGYYGMAIKSSDARAFALKSLLYYNWGETSDANIRIRGYRAGSAVSGASYTFVWPANSLVPMPISLPAAFEQVDDVRVVISGGGANGTTSWHAINNLDVTFTNSPPTAINLSNTSVMQSGGANASVGTLTSTDADPASTFAYSLVAGTGSTNNASFNIAGNVLRASNVASLPAGNYTVRVRTTDDAGGTFEQSFLVNVVDNVAATVDSIAPANNPAAAATDVYFTVTFSEAVTHVTVDDFVLVTSGNAAGVRSSVSGSGTTYTVNVASITGSGTLRLDLKSTNDIVDAGSNPTPGYTAGTTHTVLIPVAPGAPTITGVTPGAGQVVVSFSAPATDGGSPITGYTLTASPGGATLNGTGSPMTFTGLTNGTTYTFTVSATNNTGTSGPSAASAPATPRVSQSITFNNPGAQYFDTQPILSATASSSLPVTFSSSATAVCTITSGGALTFVRAGSCVIVANQAGNASVEPAGSVSQTFTVNAVAPGAPTIGTAVAGDTHAVVGFTAPASNGGATITTYTATASPGGQTASGNSSPLQVNGLTNGMQYTFTVTATNSAATGVASSASNAVTPASPQTITFNNPGTQTFGTSPTLSAGSSSSLAPTFSTDTPAVCRVSSAGVLTFTSAGSCIIQADQVGDSSFLPAMQVGQQFTVDAVAASAPTRVTATPSGTGEIRVDFMCRPAMAARRSPSTRSPRSRATSWPPATAVRWRSPG